jgi:NAD(P)-dependent dehydrogenase (short-subunit alcohol dehydrogenase family)
MSVIQRVVESVAKEHGRLDCLFNNAGLAVVGLSKNLRLEGEQYGVQVSVLCPGVVDTPTLDSEAPHDLSLAWSSVTREFLTEYSGPPASAVELAEYTLDAMERNQGTIVFPKVSRVAALLYRLSPGLIEGSVRKALVSALKNRANTRPE